MFRQSPCIVENVRCEYGKVLIDLSEAPIPNSNSGGGGDPGLLLPPSKSNVPSPSRRATTVAFKELLCSVTDVERRDLLRGFGADAEDWSIAVADKNLYVLMTCPGHRGHSNDSEQDAYTSGLPPKLDPLVSSRSMNAAIADKFFRERQLLLQVLNSDKEEWNADDWLLVIKALIDELSMAKPTAELLETLSREADDGISRLLKGSSRTDAGRALTGGERDLLLGPRIAHNRPIFVREQKTGRLSHRMLEQLWSWLPLLSCPQQTYQGILSFSVMILRWLVVLSIDRPFRLGGLGKRTEP